MPIVRPSDKSAEVPHSIRLAGIALQESQGLEFSCKGVKQCCS